jgi:hypothetical protein
MNNYTTESNTLINNTKANIMNNSNSELMALPKVSMMNLFDDITVKEEIKSPQDWTLDDCKEKLTVIFKEAKDNNEITISVRLQGLTFLRIKNNKTSMDAPSDLFTKEEVLARIIGCDEMIIEAHNRLLASLKKAKISRETTFKRKPTGARPSINEIEEDGQEYSQPSYS